MRNIVKFPIDQPARSWRGREKQWMTGHGLKTINASQAAAVTGISYEHMLEVFRVHGVRIGRIYYMPISKLERLLEGNA